MSNSPVARLLSTPLKAAPWRSCGGLAEDQMDSKRGAPGHLECSPWQGGPQVRYKLNGESEWLRCLAGGFLGHRLEESMAGYHSRLEETKSYDIVSGSDFKAISLEINMGLDSDQRFLREGWRLFRDGFEALLPPPLGDK